MGKLWYVVNDNRTDLLWRVKGSVELKKVIYKRHHHLTVADSLVDHSVANWQHIFSLLFL